MSEARSGSFLGFVRARVAPRIHEMTDGLWSVASCGNGIATLLPSPRRSGGGKDLLRTPPRIGHLGDSRGRGNSPLYRWFPWRWPIKARSQGGALHFSVLAFSSVLLRRPFLLARGLFFPLEMSRGRLLAPFAFVSSRMGQSLLPHWRETALTVMFRRQGNRLRRVPRLRDTRIGGNWLVVGGEFAVYAGRQHLANRGLLFRERTLPYSRNSFVYRQFIRFGEKGLYSEWEGRSSSLKRC